MSDVDARWTIEELEQRVARSLTASSTGDNEDAPPLRTIRYWTTLGLLDRPSAMRGRTALYGARHLLQVVAIRRLQGQRLSLEEIQSRLMALPTPALADLARVPQELLDGEPSAGVQSRRNQEFWATPPAADSTPPPPPPRLITVTLHPSITLSIATHHALQPSDVEAIERASSALLATLRERGLLPLTGQEFP